MIDIHSHVLPLVDHGSSSVEASLELLSAAAKDGVSDMILTPHYRRKNKKDRQEVIDAFDGFNAIKNQRGVAINLYLGQEIEYAPNDFLIELQNYITLNGGKYIMLEMDVEGEFDPMDALIEAKERGLIPVFAHIERYGYSLEVIKELKENGAKIQVDADGIAGKYKKLYHKYVKELIAENLVDYVASDTHSFRKSEMKRAFAVVKKKFGKKTANALFIDNAKEIIQSFHDGRLAAAGK